MLLVLACDADDGPSEREQCEQALGCVASCYALAKDDEFAPSAEECNAECGFEEGFVDSRVHGLSAFHANPVFRLLQRTGSSTAPYEANEVGLLDLKRDVEGMMSAWETCALIGEP